MGGRKSKNLPLLPTFIAVCTATLPLDGQIENIRSVRSVAPQSL